MKKLYAIHPGYIISQYDGDRHYVPFTDLAGLYGLDPKDCILWDINRVETYAGRRPEDYIHLYPRADGRYPNLGKEG